MGNQVHAWAQHLLGKNSLDECTVQELQQLAENYPYYAPAQFLLLQKLKSEGSTDYTAQLQKAVLYYHDPLLLEAVLSPDKFYTEVEEIPEPIIVEEPEATPEESVEEAEVPPVQQEEVEEIPTTEKEGIEPPEPEISESGTTILERDTISEEPPPLVEETQQPDFKFKLSTDQPSAGLTFEPFHTVDYFASQGIKLSQEEAPKDDFGKQLKSFTEWLKTMKRLPVTQMTAKIDAGSESKVQDLASDSVSDTNILTETMAEVWIKQGNYQKALEVYNKLILLNPSKKAYFAAKIENLKRS
jgi:hypothetical protein